MDKHAAVACEKCHTPEHMVPAQRALIKKTNLAQSFQGLSQDCVTCHTDVHKGQLGADCQRCHNVIDWKQAKQFDHAKTKYPLTGMHAQVSCEKCHFPSRPDKTVKFAGIKFDTCTDCHTDPHKGAFKGTCESCHTTASWKKVNASMQFDHSKTKYPLLGMHLKVACSDCHARKSASRWLLLNARIAINPDPHKGQFQTRSGEESVRSATKVEGLETSLAGVKEHATSKYPLDGKHAAVACDKCHTPAGKDTPHTK